MEKEHWGHKEVGYKYATGSRLITPTELDIFCDISGMRVDAFLDDEVAKALGAKRRFVPGVFQMALLLGFVVMWLWNWLMPDIFGLPQLTFWKAWGLVVLAHILFKSFPYHDKHDHDERWKKRFKEKFFSEKEDEVKEGLSAS